ncbi:MAG: questin oxidase family protein [Acidimicrobiales bacterium]
MISRTDTLNEALDRLHAYGYLDAPGFACHGPMGAETLSTLGHDDGVAAWVEAYKARHQPLDVPAPIDRIDPHDEQSWRPALGDVSRVSDWAAMFGRQLSDQPWPAVVSRWVPRLLSGYAGALTHGLIRVAHGVRALPTEGPPSDLLLAELAKGLAYWAATFKTLPGRPGLAGPLALPDAIARLPRPRQRWSAIEAGTFARMDELAGFPDAIEALGPPRSLDDALSDLTAAFAGMVLATTDGNVVGPVHAITPVAAVRTLQPYLTGVSVAALYGHLWHVGAAITCGFTPASVAERPSASPGAEVPTQTEIVARAVEHRDTHALKFAEACAREHARRPDPAYMLAAQHVIEQLPRW